MRILHLKAGIDITSGGPSYSTVNLCRVLAQKGTEVELFTHEPTGEVPPGTGEGFQVSYFRKTFPSCLYYSHGLIKTLRKRIREFDVVDIHGVWNLISVRAARVAQELGVPYVVTPRGMLSAWQRGFRKFHKEAFFHLFVCRAVQKASLIRFLTEQEAASSQNHLPIGRYVVIPNGIWPEDFEDLDSEGFRERFHLGDYPYVVFLGRLHPIKRLDLQCTAFKLLAPRFKDLHWVFVGPDNGVRKKLEASLKESGVVERVRFTGLLSGKERLSALAGATVYCHTSTHEGHSVAITEALACGRPCVVTQGCHFDQIEKAGAGLVVFPDSMSIAEAVAEILNDPKKCEQMEQNARRLACEEFAWSGIASRMLDIYREIISSVPNLD